MGQFRSEVQEAPRPGERLDARQDAAGDRHPETGAGVRLLENGERGITAAVHAGERYSLAREAARVHLETRPGGRSGAAYLVEVRQAEFARGTPALRLALDRALDAAGERGLHVVHVRLGRRALQEMPPVERARLVSGLRAEGFRVGYTAQTAQGERHLVHPGAAQAVFQEVVGEPLAIRAVLNLDQRRLPAQDRTPQFEMDGVEQVRLRPRYTTPEQVRLGYEQALQDFTRGENNQLLVDRLPPGLELRDLVEKEPQELGMAGRNAASYYASLAERAGLEPSAEGTAVHRLMELRTNYRHAGEIARGQRRTEQWVEYVRGGEQRHVELDLVLQRGEQHWLRDYKPVDLGKFEETRPGQAWAKWMEAHIGPDFRRQVARGRVPFEPGMPLEMRHAVRQYIHDATHQYDPDLEKYRQLYARAAGINPDQVHPAPSPYFVFRHHHV